MPNLAPDRIQITGEHRSPSPAARPKSKAWQWFACQLKHDVGEGSGFQNELAALLHNRLRMATAIMAATYLAIILIGFILPDMMPMRFWDHVINNLAALLVGGIAALLWLRQGLKLCQLRRLEVLFFGTVAAHFAFVSAILMEEVHQSRVLLNRTEPELGLRLAMFTFLFLFRWCMLIVIYGVFIPNTARRTALTSALFSAVPLGMLIYFMNHEGLLAKYLVTAFPFNVLVLALSSAVAVFGSHKIASLQQEAYVSRQLGQYRLKNRLGLGGMGEVYLAEHLLLKRPCVVKLIRSEKAADPATQARFEREVSAMAKLTHWNTVAVFDYGRTVDGTFYYVMEYLPGLSLQEMVAIHGAMPAARVIHLLRQVCAALHEAHANSLIHRDIKPSNIIVCPVGGVHDVVKLVDFGLVFKQDWNDSDAKLTREGFIVGTPDFLSPEQAQDGEAVDARSDIYSLGAVAYFLLTGQSVFPRKNAMQVVVAHVHEAVPPLPKSVPWELAKVVHRCLEKRPSQRYGSAKELEDALTTLAEDEPWSQEDAAQWWAEHKDGDKAAQFDTPTLVTAAV